MINLIKISVILTLKFLGIFVIASFIGSAPVALADPVTARGSERDGIARMAFTWPAPVPFLARIQNKEIIVQFARPAEGNFTNMVKVLDKYIRPPRIQNGGTVLIFPLVGNFDLNYFSRGRTVVIAVSYTHLTLPTIYSV